MGWCGAIALVAIALASCSDDTGGRASPEVTTTTEASTSSSSSSSSSTTIAPTTTVPARSTTTAAARSPESAARTLYDAWTKGDRAAAAQVAQPAAVTGLFGRRWQAGDGWSFAECSGAAGSLICAWQRPAGEQLLLRVRTATGGQPVTVAEVRFQP